MTDYKSPLPTNQGSTKLSEISVDTSSTLLGADAHDSALRVTEQILKITADLLRRQNYFLRSSGVINWNTSNQIEFSGSDIYMDILQTENATQPLISLVLQASDFTSIEVLDGEILYLELDSTLISTLGSTIVIENGLSGGGTEGKRVKKGTSMPTIVSPIDGLSISTTYCLPIAYAKGSVVHWVPHGITWPAATTSRLGAVIVEGQEPYQDVNVNDYIGLTDALSNLSLTGGIILLTTSINIPTATTLSIPENVKVIGRGPKSELVMNGTSTIKMGKNSDLENLKITAAADFTGNAIHMDSLQPCQRASLSNVTIDMSAAVDTPQINSWNFNAVDGSKLTTNSVKGFAKQSDGKIILFGSFYNYGGVTGRDFLVRLNADGTADEDFCTKVTDYSKFNNIVNAVYVDSSDNIFIGGDFTDYKATGRHSLVKLTSSGDVDTVFCAGASDGVKINGPVLTIAYMASTGWLYFGGMFTNYTGSLKNYIARVSPTTGIDSPMYAFVHTYLVGPTTYAKFSAYISDIKVSGTSLYIAGGFTNFMSIALGSGISYFVKTDSRGDCAGADLTFTNNATRNVSIPYFNNAIRNLALDSAGNIYLGGLFTNYRNPNRNYLVKLDSTGNMSSTFNTNAVDGGQFTNAVYSLAVDSSNSIYVGGSFINYKSPTFTNRNRLVKLDSSGSSTSDSFNTNAVDGAKFVWQIEGIAILDGKIYVGGAFTSYIGGTGRNRAVKLNPDGTADANLLQSAVNVTGVRVEANNCRINHCWFKGVASAAQRTGINYVTGYTDNADVDSLFE